MLFSKEKKVYRRVEKERYGRSEITGNLEEDKTGPPEEVGSYITNSRKLYGARYKKGKRIQKGFGVARIRPKKGRSPLLKRQENVKAKENLRIHDSQMGARGRKKKK